MEIGEIYQNVDKIVLKHIMFYDDVMTYSQSFGYNGFKRMFRVLEKQMLCWHIQLKNDFFDYYRSILKAPAAPNTLTFNNIKTLLEGYRNILAEDISALAKLGKEHIEETGIECAVIRDIIICLKHKWNKISRWISRFNETNWNTIEIHIVDDYLHTKMEEEEEK